MAVLVAWLSYLALHETCRSSASAPGRITTTFTATGPRLQPAGAILELAAYEAVQSFRRTDGRAVFFHFVPLGTNVTGPGRPPSRWATLLRKRD